MAYEMLVGLNVLDDRLYQEYRTEMKPILAIYGGGFGYDFKVAEMLQSEADAEINRVFTIYFENSDAMDGFFSDADYLKVKQQFFDKSVGSVTIISSYEKAVI
ncbi:DUF1330 domain-containing protein [Amphritea sp. HPY]|uniref:DUF1330 domain-containing protein n=1 Tax=Amphritea sp. HPY TaxID=3421652 RepID=UPI003D7E6B2B